MYHSEGNTFRNVGESKISITDLYKFIRHMHECQLNSVKHFYKYLSTDSNATALTVISLTSRKSKAQEA